MLEVTQPTDQTAVFYFPNLTTAVFYFPAAKFLLQNSNLAGEIKLFYVVFYFPARNKQPDFYFPHPFI